MATAMLSTTGKVTIPAAVRASLGLETGSRIEFVEAANGQYLIVAATQPVQALKGMLCKPESAVSIEAIKQIIASSGASLR